MASKKPTIEILVTFATPQDPENHKATNMKTFKAGRVIRNCSDGLLIGLAEQGKVAKFVTPITPKESDA